MIDDTSNMTPSLLRARARRYRRKVGTPGLIIVDYLQLMRSPEQENRTQEISEISRSLKALAKELGCPVVALSQLNRQLEQRADKRPTNGDLRDSGSLEQDADLILFCTAMRCITNTHRTKVWQKLSSVSNDRDRWGR